MGLSKSLSAPETRTDMSGIALRAHSNLSLLVLPLLRLRFFFLDVSLVFLEAGSRVCRCRALIIVSPRMSLAGRGAATPRTGARQLFSAPFYARHCRAHCSLLLHERAISKTTSLGLLCSSGLLKTSARRGFPRDLKGLELFGAVNWRQPRELK